MERIIEQAAQRIEVAEEVSRIFQQGREDECPEDCECESCMAANREGEQARNEWLPGGAMNQL